MAVTQKISDGVSRRVLLTGGMAGGFLLAFHLPVRALAPNEPVQPPDVTDGKFAPNAFIRIDNAGKTTLVMPQVEMGQGVYTAVAMILAEELDADFAQLTGVITLAGKRTVKILNRGALEDRSGESSMVAEGRLRQGRIAA